MKSYIYSDSCVSFIEYNLLNKKSEQIDIHVIRSPRTFGIFTVNVQRGDIVNVVTGQV